METSFKKTLEQAPLVHAVIHLRVTTVPSLSVMSEELENNIHERMVKKDFPEKIISTADTHEFFFEANANKMPEVKQNKKTEKRLLFRASGGQRLIEISSRENGITSIIFKTTNYLSHNDFFNDLNNLLQSLLEVVPGLSSSLLKSVGIRYINALVPKKGHDLSEFVSEGVLPLALTNFQKMSHVIGVSAKQIETSENQMLNVRIEELRSFQGKVTKVLPDDLLEQDQKCSLSITGHDDWRSMTSETYGMLDIDHSYIFIDSPIIDKEQVMGKITELYSSSNEAFWCIISDTAKGAWGYKEAMTNV